MVCEHVVSFLPIAYFYSTEGATYHIATICKVKSSSRKVIFIHEGFNFAAHILLPTQTTVTEICYKNLLKYYTKQRFKTTI